jgi:osmotically-inducible protein OsmY
LIWVNLSSRDGARLVGPCQENAMKTDRQLQQDVIEELLWEPSVEATTIGVEVKDGIVTLAGHVETLEQQLAAERAAQRVAGVKGIVVEIDVVLPGSGKRPDAEIAEAAIRALEWNSSVPGDAIKITVQDGWVTLTGEVDWAFQRWAAIATVRSLIGVVAVSDEILIKPQIQPRDVKVKIEAALQRHAHRETKAINVDVAGDSVTLSGVVDSWAEREAAHTAAWAAPGVKSVVDNILVAPSA